MRNSRFALLLVLSLFVSLSACRKDDDDNPGESALDEALNEALLTASSGVGKAFYQMPNSDDLDNIPQDDKNPLSSEKVALGKMLYHETGLAVVPLHEEAKGTYSCASCHFASAGFQAGRFQGVSEGGIGFGINGEGREVNNQYLEEELDVQPVRTPSAMNLAYQEVILWNGQFGAVGLNGGTDYAWVPGTPIETNNLGYEGLEIQAIAGLKVHRLDVDSVPSIIEDLGYKSMFDAAFPDVDQSVRYSREYTGLAIAAYERTLLANQSPFQEYLRGDIQAMNDQQKRGAILFFGEAQCASCHNGPGLNAMEFHAIGMGDLVDCPEPTFKTTPDNTENLGRGGFTGEAEDMYKFKVPQLYNLADSPFYGHGASFRTIKEVIEYKNNAVPQNPEVPQSQLADGFEPLGLTDDEINDLTVFIKYALHDPNLKRYEPESLLSGNCFPFNDPQSRIDLGCE